MALSARAIYDEIRSNDTTFRLFCAITAKGESQGGWENALARDASLSAKIRRHGADEAQHLACCHEELLRRIERGHGERIRSMLRRNALGDPATATT